MIFELVYRSTLPPNAKPTCVSDIVRFARSFNRDHDITGLLVFDGEHFLHLLEGEQRTVTALAARIERDRRHAHFELAHEAERNGERRFPKWSLAYALDVGGELYTSLVGERGPALAMLLEQHAASLDIGAASEADRAPPGRDPARRAARAARA